jgi:hypothetical protein
MARHDLGQQAGVVPRQVRDHDKCQAAIRRHVLKEKLQCLDSSGGAADACHWKDVVRAHAGVSFCFIYHSTLNGNTRQMYVACTWPRLPFDRSMSSGRSRGFAERTPTLPRWISA